MSIKLPPGFVPRPGSYVFKEKLMTTERVCRPLTLREQLHYRSMTLAMQATRWLAYGPLRTHTLDLVLLRAVMLRKLEALYVRTSNAHVALTARWTR
jgi:hypothetical protein